MNKKFITGIAIAGFFAMAYFFAAHERGTEKNTTTVSATENHPQASGSITMSSRLGTQSDAQSQAVRAEIQKILEIKHKKDIPDVIKNLVNLSKTTEYPGIKILGMYAELFQGLEGIVWRCRGFAEKSDIMQTTAMYSLRNYFYYRYTYGNHITALFNWITDPPRNKDAQVFNNISDLQDYLLKIAPNIVKMITGLNQIIKENQANPDNLNFAFDRRLFVGLEYENGQPIRFLDETETERQFIFPYAYTFLFQLERMVATIYYISTIDLNDLPNVLQSILAQTFINQQKKSIGGYRGALGITPEMAFTEGKKFPNFLKQRSDLQNVNVLLNYAKYYATLAAKDQLTAYTCGINYFSGDRTCHNNTLQVSDAENLFIPHGKEYLYNPNSMLLDVKKKYTALVNRNDLYQSKEGEYKPFTSTATGEQISLNVHELFKPHADFKDWFPTEFSHTDHNESAAESNPAGGYIEKKSNRWVWNYNHGRPKTFPDPTFGGFIKGATNQNIYETVRTLLYTDGLSQFATFLTVPSPVQFMINLQDWATDY